ncbi:MAG: phosphomannomutase [Gammaproteobacteria bacterium]|nr:phosphomannomutase [Gammaproteobacteria bacterium]
MENQKKTVQISDLMTRSGVKFGTSGARGLVTAMTDEVCYAYTQGFIQHLRTSKQIEPGATLAIAGDLRSSTNRIVNAAAAAIRDGGYTTIHCGRIPAPAVAGYGLENHMASLMVTGSHIPEDRNGIKFNSPTGEILKSDETGIREQQVHLPQHIFDNNGMFIDPSYGGLPPASNVAYDHYIQRFINFFPDNFLAGKSLGLYEHSTVGRDIFYDILTRLGAQVTQLGHASTFISVDTEAIRPEDIALALQWAKKYHFDAIISADGDADRPLISDENGNWVRGDVAGIIVASALNANVVATPVSCNTAVEKCGRFDRVSRTKIGSPFVIEAMKSALQENEGIVVGYEANGGFLTGCDITRNNKTLKALPTRDALLVPLSMLLLSVEKNKPVSALVNELPPRYTASNRVKAFPTELSKARLATLIEGDKTQSIAAIECLFKQKFGRVSNIDTTDGLRITFESDEIIHLRPSGNAPEFRCYNEADSALRAEEMNTICMTILTDWKNSH